MKNSMNRMREKCGGGAVLELEIKSGKDLWEK